MFVVLFQCQHLYDWERTTTQSLQSMHAAKTFHLRAMLHYCVNADIMEGSWKQRITFSYVGYSMCSLLKLKVSNCKFWIGSSIQSLTTRLKLHPLEQVFFQSTLFFLHTLQAPTYPVDDFRLKGADDAAVVENWMFLITLFKGCGCLRGEQGHVVIALQSTVGSVYVFVCVWGSKLLCLCSCASAWW